MYVRLDIYIFKKIFKYYGADVHIGFGKIQFYR